MSNEIRQCGEILFQDGKACARCTLLHGDDHSHSDYTAREYVMLGLADPIPEEPADAGVIPCCSDLPPFDTDEPDRESIYT